MLTNQSPPLAALGFLFQPRIIPPFKELYFRELHPFFSEFQTRARLDVWKENFKQVFAIETSKQEKLLFKTSHGQIAHYKMSST